MNSMKPRKPKLSERNRVFWIDRNFRREHSAVCPKPMWITVHRKAAVVIAAAVVLLLADIAFAPVFEPIEIPLFHGIWLAAMTLMFADGYEAKARVIRFNKEYMNRGGEIIDPWNARIMKRSDTRVSLAVTIFLLLIIYAYVGFVVYAKISWTSGDDLIPNFYVFWFPLYTFSFLYQSACPYIFMDLDEGMIFSDALFPYDVLCDIRPTGRGSGFELYHGGKKIASGNMLPDDMEHLQGIIAIRKQYRKYLPTDSEEIFS